MLPTNKSAKNDLGLTDPTNLASFTEIGGLLDHIKLLRELVVVPLLYPNIYTQFRIKPPRGVLFHGPPGTGKTMVAGALANECCKKINGRVSFFSRKGGDVLNKWVGESEEKLRALFRKAFQSRPSIIFFDELDGLAPTRSAHQDQVHSNVVATLLALMDGLDRMAGVVVIGATNRLDSIDPALRRPGRFDREIYFPLPSMAARREILEVYVNSWSVKPKPSFLTYLADVTVGYSGSDLQALCSEAVLSCLRRHYPSINSTSKIYIKPQQLKIEQCDFLKARNSIIPAVQRLYVPVRRLTSIMEPILQPQLDHFILLLKSRWPHFLQANYNFEFGKGRYAGKVMLVGAPNQGHNEHIAPAMLHALEHLPIHVMDVQSLYENGGHASEETCIMKLKQARQNLPAIILIYRLDEWWYIVEESTRVVISSLLEDVHVGLPLLIFGTTTNTIPLQLQHYFNHRNSIMLQMTNPTIEQRQLFLKSIFIDVVYKKYVKIRKLLLKRSMDEQSKERKQRPLKRKQETDIQESLVKRKLFDAPRVHNVLPSCPAKRNKCKYNTRSYSRKLTYLKAIKTQNKKSDDEIQTYYVNSNFLNAKAETSSVTNTNDCYMDVDEQMTNDNNQNMFIDDVGDSYNDGMEKLKFLYQRAVSVTTKNMGAMQLESFYDACITKLNLNYKNTQDLFQHLESIMAEFENGCMAKSSHQENIVLPNEI